MEADIPATTRSLHDIGSMITSSYTLAKPVNPDYQDPGNQAIEYENAGKQVLGLLSLLIYGIVNMP